MLLISWLNEPETARSTSIQHKLNGFFYFDFFFAVYIILMIYKYNTSRISKDINVEILLFMCRPSHPRKKTLVEIRKTDYIFSGSGCLLSLPISADSRQYSTTFFRSYLVQRNYLNSDCSWSGVYYKSPSDSASQIQLLSYIFYRPHTGTKRKKNTWNPTLG